MTVLPPLAAAKLGAIRQSAADAGALLAACVEPLDQLEQRKAELERELAAEA